MNNLLKIRLSLKGRPIRTYTFNKPEITIGRDPGSDIFLDNTGISREHARVERTSGGFVIEDQGSANGTFLNDRVVTRELLRHEDVVRIGKFSLWVEVGSDRRDRGGSRTPTTSDVHQGTTILSAEQMIELTRKAQLEEESAAAVAEDDAGAPWMLTRTGAGMAVGAALLLGIFVGAAAALHYFG
jgi:pSer/pThr/pTyr-binding forkhead associated (FHA) protein